jgi:transcription elongation factor Elf1
MIRFDQPAYPTAYFSDLIYVVCPQCRQVAKVETTIQNQTKATSSKRQSVLSCKYCGLVQANTQKWYGTYQAFVNTPCGNCGSRVLFTSKPLKKTSPMLTISCEVCKKEKAYQPQWFRYKSDHSKEPYYGLDVFLQIGVKNHTLWLYNSKHLQYVKDYIAASLREDDSRHKYSMITNLPQWIKSAKNRDLILKKLRKLEQTLKAVDVA